MRLKQIERGARLGTRAFYAFFRVVAGQRAPDVVRTLRHKSAEFGDAYSAAVQAALRGPSAWSVGERELFAAYTSKLNQCRF